MSTEGQENHLMTQLHAALLEPYILYWKLCIGNQSFVETTRNGSYTSRSVTSGARGAQSRGRRKSPQCRKYFLQYSTFTPKRSQVRAWGRQTWFLDPGAVWRRYAPAWHKQPRNTAHNCSNPLPCASNIDLIAAKFLTLFGVLGLTEAESVSSVSSGTGNPSLKASMYFFGTKDMLQAQPHLQYIYTLNCTMVSSALIGGP